ncbi:MAG: GTP cyclohydrolase I [Schumannella sp.]
MSIDSRGSRQAVAEILAADREERSRSGLAATSGASPRPTARRPRRGAAARSTRRTGWRASWGASSIDFRSVCEHHLLPFTGVAHLAYVPGERIGLSASRRGRDLFAPATAGAPGEAVIADAIQTGLAPGVVLVGRRPARCVTARRTAGDRPP